MAFADKKNKKTNNYGQFTFTVSDIPYEKILKVLFKDSLYFFLLLLSPLLKMAIIHKKCLFLLIPVL